MPGVRCPICERDSGGGYVLEDATLYVCPDCGGYRLAPLRRSTAGLCIREEEVA